MVMGKTRGWVFLTGTLLTITGPCCCLDLVIESRAQGKNNSCYKEIEGLWTDAQFPPYRSKSSAPGLTEPAKCGSRKFVFMGEGANPQNPPASVRFSPQFTSPVHLYVYATWPSGASATPVTYVIKHAKGDTRVTVTQDGWADITGSSNSNLWVLIGDYDFSAGADQHVELRVDPGVATAQDARGKHYGQVYADAVRFTSEPISGASAAAAPTPSAPGPAVHTPDPAGNNNSNAFTSSTAPPSARGTPTSTRSYDLKWYEDVQEGFRAAQKAEKKILVFFYTPGSASSVAFEQLFQDRAIRSVLSQRYITIRLNFLQNTDLGYKLGAFKGGTINIYTSSGTALDQIADNISASRLEAKLLAY